jgi:uncharacterized protein (TIGR03437 family)
MKFLLLCSGLFVVFAVNSLRASCTQAQPPSLVGRWQIEFKFSTVEEHTLRFDARTEGKGSFLLLDTASNLIPPAEQTKAQWEQAASGQVTFSGEIEFPIGNVGRDAGTLVFKGAFDSPNSISGKVSFFRAGQDPKDPAAVPAKTGDFTAKRSTVTNVSAASYSETALANESIVAAFGSNLATAIQASDTLPLPTSLAGTTVTLRTRSGMERLAPLFFVSPGQVNYLMPAGTVDEAATIIVTSGDGSVATGLERITRVAPGLFSADARGQGVAAGVALRVKADGSQSFEPVGRFDPAQARFVTVPIDLGPESDQVFLVLFGTGFRFTSSLSSVVVRIGDVDSRVLFAGAQGNLAGLDQLNVHLPRSLIGRGELDVVLVVDGKQANTVRVNVK